MSKLSDKLKNLFSKNRGASKGANYPAKFEQTAFKAGQKTRNLFTGKKKATVLSKSKDLVTAGAAKKLRTASKVAKLARVATPLGLGTVAAQAVYDVATMSPEKKAKVKKLKTKLSKKSTKDYHADLLKMSTGGDTMLKGGQKKLDKNKDGKISGEDFKMMKPKGAALGTLALGALGAFGAAKMLGKKKKAKIISPVALLDSLREEDKGNQVATGQQKASKGKMMKAFKGSMADSKKSSQERSKLMVQLKKKISGAAISESEAEKLMNMSTPEIKSKIKNMYKGGESKGYGAARTQGQGLQDENLIPGKSLDYYKDIM